MLGIPGPSSSTCKLLTHKTLVFVGGKLPQLLWLLGGSRLGMIHFEDLMGPLPQ